MTIQDTDYIELKKENTTFRFLTTGDLFDAYHHDIMINQVKNNPVDGSMNNLYLRFFTENEVTEVYPLIGVLSQSQLSANQQQLKYTGQIKGVSYEVLFTLATENAWFWDITLDGNSQTVDIIYGQDIGVAYTGALQSNEAYVSQYLDHKVFEKEGYYTIASRQNQKQGETNPYLEQGSLTGAIHYTTDGYQFFGKEYKLTNQPAALKKERLASEVYQYEFAYIGLQSTKVVLDQTRKINFYGLIKESHPNAVTQLEFKEELSKAVAGVINIEPTFAAVEVLRRNGLFSQDMLTGTEFTEAEIDYYFPKRQAEEKKDNQLLSFFSETNEHIVLQAKECQMERSHGHILMSGTNTSIYQETMTSTSYMYGLFQAQIVLGNTSMNKFNTNARNALNFFKTSGQRVYIKRGEYFYLLTMPSAYEMGFNYAKWFYKLEEDVLILTVYTATDTTETKLTITSTKEIEYEWLVTNQVIMNDIEYNTAYNQHFDSATQTYFFTPDFNSGMIKEYPDLSYQLHYSGSHARIFTEAEFFENAQENQNAASLFSLHFDKTAKVELSITASLVGNTVTPSKQTFRESKEIYRSYLSDLMNGFQLSKKDNPSIEITRLNITSYWYTHNMLVHYLVPHGLEQYGGAAWGTRDVCQGPAEFFLANQKYDIVREIILILFSHQFVEDGNWPQWFMFDKYENTMADESHGDIIVWPLKLIGDYLTQTGDTAILNEPLNYMSKEQMKTSGPKEPLVEHVKKAIAYIKEHFLPETYLSCYGDGDWDDTLQPNNQTLKENMASTWTVSLTYQVLKRFSKSIVSLDSDWSKEMKTLSESIGADFRKYMLKTEILPGFVLMHEGNQPEYIIHPEDTKTGIDYRLLPMTRSMISELLTPAEKDNHLKIIQKELQMPDGVHLMSQPANYTGGVSTYFKRAEQSANFGREIGLQYVHAHIRFVEAMAKIGEKNEAWKALQTVNPVLIQENVPNAEIRQSNAYFSSSDGKFATRYEAGEKFNELRTGERTVKGGWRIYSSGPGIYINQLISNVLGFRLEQQDLIIDPVLPDDLNGLRFTYAYLGRPLTVTFELGTGKEFAELNGCAITGNQLENPYRQGGVRYSKETIIANLAKEKNVLRIVR